MIAGVNAWRLWEEHWEHKAHEGPIEERTEYPYMNIRTKNFFWGDGDKVSRAYIPGRYNVGEGKQDRCTACDCEIPKTACLNAADLSWCRRCSGTTRSTTTRKTSKILWNGMMCEFKLGRRDDLPGGFDWVQMA